MENAKKIIIGRLHTHTQTQILAPTQSQLEKSRKMRDGDSTQVYIQKSWKNCSNEKMLVCLHSIDGKDDEEKKTFHRMRATKFKQNEKEKHKNEFEKRSQQ